MAERPVCSWVNAEFRLVTMQGFRQAAPQDQTEGQNDGAQAKGDSPAVSLQLIRGQDVSEEQPYCCTGE